MPEYLAPGVYIEEVETGSKPIEGVSTSTSAAVGVTERGPVNEPTFVSGLADFTRQFGGFLNRRVFTGANWLLPHAVDGFFTNGGKRLFVVRVLPGEAAAPYAEMQLFGEMPGGFSGQLIAMNRRGEPFLLVDDPAGLAAAEWVMIDDGARSEYVRVIDADVIALRAALPDGATAGTDVVPYTFAATPAPNDLDTNPTNDIAAGVNEIVVDSIANLAPDDILRIGADDTREFVVVDSVPATATDPLTLRSPLAFDHPASDEVIIVDAAAAPATDLSDDAEAGDQVIVVADETAVAGADAIGFGAPPASYYVTVGALGVTAVEAPGARFRRAAGTLVVQPDLDTTVADRAFAADAETGATEIEVDSRADLDTDTFLRLDGGNGIEYVRIGAVDADATPGPVALVQPLRGAYSSGDAVSPRKDNDNDSDATALARVLSVGETTLLLVEGGAYTGAGTLRIGELADPRIEYIDFVATDAEVVALETLPRSSHASGVQLGERRPFLRVRAIDRGAWGDSLRVTAEDEDEPTLDTTVPSGGGGSAGDPSLTLTTGVGLEPGALLEFTPEGAAQPAFSQKVDSIAGNVVTFGPTGLEQPVMENTRVRTAEFKLTVECMRTNPRTGKEAPDPELSETLRNLSFDPRQSRYVEPVIGRISATDERGDGEAALIRVDDLFSQTAALASERPHPDLLTETLPDGTRPVGLRLQGGGDGLAQIDDNALIGTDAVDPDDRTGLQALKNIEEISIVAMPGRTSNRVQNALLAHCELMRYRFAVLDSERGTPPAGLRLEQVQTQRQRFDSKYGALYYPWLVIDDPFPENPVVPEQVWIPPSGHILGIYARSDYERGVHKAPANEVIRGINDLQIKLVKEQQDLINPRNINALRDFRDRGRGLRVWGARVVTSDPDWRYLNVRRLFNYVEASIERGTQWVVFEPNDHRLWARLTQSVSAFLTAVWRDGALMGRAAEQAFYVKCDETTMTQYDIDNGRLIMLIGIAPVKPAEFVVIRIGQWAGGSLVEEA